MSEDLVRVLDRGYTMMWREGSVEEALSGLGDDFEWVVPNHPEGERAARRRRASSSSSASGSEPCGRLDVDWEPPARLGPDRALAIIDMRGRGRESGVPAEMHFAPALDVPRRPRSCAWSCTTTSDEARRAAGLE